MVQLTGAPGTAANEIGTLIRGALLHAAAMSQPFRHWLLRDVLSAATVTEIERLPIAPPQIGETRGKRETHNATRSYFSVDNLALYAVCHDVAAAFQDGRTVRAIEQLCGTSLAGGLLRIEYCQDREGFWLEPHTDIGAKLCTLIIYLSDGPQTLEWGTDLYDAAHNWVGRAPFGRGRGLIFVPADDTWHGLARRHIEGVRRSLIVNYVKDEWRARHELSFPDAPVG